MSVKLLQRRVLQGLERIGLPVKNNLLAIPSAQIVELNIKFGTNKNKELHPEKFKGINIVFISRDVPRDHSIKNHK